MVNKAFNINPENDNYKFVINDGVFGLTEESAAILLNDAYYNDEYKALYNDEGWVITEENNEYNFTSENGAFFENFNKAQVDFIADLIK